MAKIGRGIFAMSNVTGIHQGRQPRRPHHVQAWAEKRGLSQADIAREIGVDKSVVSRWFSGSTPSHSHQQALAGLFHVEPESLFRDPDEDWISRLLRDATPEERAKVRSVVEMMLSKAS
jgi:transcriptional regulator with XRE-family HTH domain